MKLIKGMIHRHIFQIVIHTVILTSSFVFLLISVFLGCEMNSFVGAGIILFAVLFVYMIVATVFKMQIMIDRDVWKSLYKIGIMRQESEKIVRSIDLIFVVVSVLLSLIIGNYLIQTYLYHGKALWMQNLITVFMEVIIAGIAYKVQMKFLEQRYEEKQEIERKNIKENAPLFWKNVARNQEKMRFIVSIICIGLIACCGILFVCYCDNSDCYIEKAIAADYFLTGIDTRSDEIRTDSEVVD